MKRITELDITKLLDEAIAESDRLGIRISVATVDEAGYLSGFKRHGDAEIVSITLAQDKAYSALFNRVGTDELGKLCAPGAELYGLQYNLGGRMVIFGGGVPIRNSEGRLIGAIGVSGGTVEQDIRCAMAAIEILK
ncbi:heme-binding protein [Paenibacillus sp. N1-5-1-14]|uniref:GlcG/HbpS family heme-binding protein n=1 Tax=Paenibacillus radicibacter TaxID=2972488 RepID=UPI0021593326|nr:heme-binding protein [Paenibacillus radicibacter]MCR8644880.1 heme-binding protein [Paenibacillus radicibacter]